MLYALLVHFYQAVPPVFLWGVGERGRRIEKRERTEVKREVRKLGREKHLRRAARRSAGHSGELSW